MTDQEIMEKYQKSIEKNVQNICETRGIIEADEIKKVAETYKSNFVQGFKEGVEKSQFKIAINLIKENASVDLIHQITELPLSAIETLKKQNANNRSKM